MSNTTRLLGLLGLNSNEVTIYLSLIQTGAQSIQKIAKTTSIPRSTVYQRVESLRKAGFITSEIGERGEVISAVHPSVIKEKISHHKKQVQEMETMINTALPQLSNLFQPDSKRTKVMYFEGVEGIRRMIMNYEMEAKNKDLYGYTMDIEKILGEDFIKKYHKKFYKKGYRDHYILNDKPEHRKFLNNVHKTYLYQEKRIFIRLLPKKQFDPHVNVSMFDDKYSISLIEKGKPFGVIIQNKKIVEHQLEIFQILWKAAKSV